MDKFWKWFVIAVTVFLAIFLLVVCRFEQVGNLAMYRCRYTGKLYEAQSTGKLISMDNTDNLLNRISSLEGNIKAYREHLIDEREENKKLKERLAKFAPLDRRNKLSTLITFENIEPLYRVIDRLGNKRDVKAAELSSALKDDCYLIMDVKIGTQKHELTSHMDEYQMNSLLKYQLPVEIIYTVSYLNATYEVPEGQIQEFMSDFILQEDILQLEALSKRKRISLDERHPSPRFDSVRKSNLRKTK